MFIRNPFRKGGSRDRWLILVIDRRGVAQDIVGRLFSPDVDHRSAVNLPPGVSAQLGRRCVLLRNPGDEARRLLRGVAHTPRAGRSLLVDADPLETPVQPRSLEGADWLGLLMPAQAPSTGLALLVDADRVPAWVGRRHKVVSGDASVRKLLAAARSGSLAVVLRPRPGDLARLRAENVRLLTAQPVRDVEVLLPVWQGAAAAMRSHALVVTAPHGCDVAQIPATVSIGATALGVAGHHVQVAVPRLTELLELAVHTARLVRADALQRPLEAHRVVRRVPHPWLDVVLHLGLRTNASALAFDLWIGERVLAVELEQVTEMQYALRTFAPVGETSLWMSDTALARELERVHQELLVAWRETVCGVPRGEGGRIDPGRSAVRPDRISVVLRRPGGDPIALDLARRPGTASGVHVSAAAEDDTRGHGR